MNFKKSNSFLFFILFIDILFILLSILDYFSDFKFGYFNVAHENKFAEQFQYLKFLVIATISFLLAIKKRSSQFLVLMIIPIYLLGDDAIQLHERFGTALASFLYEGNHNDTLISNFRYQDIGEILYMSLISIFLFVTFLICLKSSDSFERYFLKKILKLFIIFGIFALFIDSIHQLFHGFMYDLLDVIEDGGEMISISFITAYFLKFLQITKKNII